MVSTTIKIQKKKEKLSEMQVYRKRNKLSCNELGKILGVGNSSISVWERGLRPMPKDVEDRFKELLK